MVIVWYLLFMVLLSAPGIWYHIAIGKRIAHEEKKAGRDLTYEINPFTGGRE
ncbi:hypothetical protein PO903_13995 [Paenibacillus sp. PK4536]|uniref:Uncharacterized protein n=1 Tax=Paenibacillus nuruki TaxID=1886670 RepID=A0A1E3L4L5_9BACL|nr:MULTISPECIES: hypothetical protein [Paenibacillus]ODP28686.1 hypothetical protein PTI45_01981 [Paenibacillus nuruki]WIM37761.1 hypothetical protein PO903_13995 [Paenibacillus sp. PK4536]CAJ1315591.1 Transcriptional regulator [Paenibacillus nuruki]